MATTTTPAGWRRTRHRGVYRATPDEVRRSVSAEVEALGMPLEEFVRHGGQGELDDERAQALWRLYGDYFAER
jgi:hypothetical protein